MNTDCQTQSIFTFYTKKEIVVNFQNFFNNNTIIDIV